MGHSQTIKDLNDLNEKIQTRTFLISNYFMKIMGHQRRIKLIHRSA